MFATHFSLDKMAVGGQWSGATYDAETKIWDDGMGPKWPNTPPPCPRRSHVHAQIQGIGHVWDWDNAD